MTVLTVELFTTKLDPRRALQTRLYKARLTLLDKTIYTNQWQLLFSPNHIFSISLCADSQLRGVLTRH